MKSLMSYGRHVLWAFLHIDENHKGCEPPQRDTMGLFGPLKLVGERLKDKCATLASTEYLTVRKK